MTVLFAQFGPPAGGGAANNPFANPAFLVGFLVAIFAVMAVVLVIFIFFLLTLHRALARCRRENRTLEPGMVWLNLIPLFSIFWTFITVNRIADSLRNEFEDRDMDEAGESYGRAVGMAYAWCGLANLLFLGVNVALTLGGNLLAGQAVGCVSNLVGLTALVCWIVYWVKIAGYSRELRDAELDDDYDDRPRRRRSRRDDEEYEDDRPRRDDDDGARGDDRGKPWER